MILAKFVLLKSPAIYSYKKIEDNMNFKNKFLHCLLLVGSVLGLVSCSNEEIPDQISEGNLSPQEFLNITYDGKEYINVPTAYDENGDFVFLDEEFSKIYDNELKDLPTLSIHLIDDKNIEMFRSLETNLTAHGFDYSKISDESASITRTIVSPEENFIGTADLYDDQKFKDRHLQLGISEAIHPAYINDLKTYGFNDKCSSLKLWNHLPKDESRFLDMGTYLLTYAEASLIFIGNDDRYFSDRTYTAYADASEQKEYKELKNFNDKMSSCRLFFSKRDPDMKEGASK